MALRAFPLVTLLLTVAVGHVRAQEPAPTTPQVDTAAVAPITRIPPADIPERAVGVSTRLNALRAQIAADTVTGEVETLLGALADTVDSADDSLIAAQLERQSLDNLLEIERRWRAVERRLEDWQTRLAGRSRVLDTVRDTLARIRATWELTRDSTPQPDLTPELRDRVVSTIRSIDSTQTQLRVPRQRVLALQDQAAQRRVSVTEVINTVRSAQDVARRRLFRLDAAPLWQIFSVPTDETRPVSMLVQSDGDRLRAISAYVTDHAERVWVHLILLATVLTAVFSVRKRATTWRTSEYRIYSPADLFSRPVAASMLLTLALSRPIHSIAPQAFFSLLWIVGIPLLAVFLPSILGPRALRTAWAVLAVFAVEMLLDIVPLGPVAYRLALLALQVAVVLGLVLFLRSRDAIEWARRSRWWRVARWVAVIGVAAAGAAVLANAVGFVGLSLLLVRGVINGATSALALVAVVAVADGLIVIFIEATLRHRLRVIDANRRRVIGRATTLIRIAAVVLWLLAVGRDTRTLQPVLDAIDASLRVPLMLGSWSITLGDVFIFGFAVWLTLAVSSTTRALLREDVLARLTLPRGVGDAVSSIVYYVLLALGFLFAVGAAGVDLSQLAIVLGALSVGIGFGLQNVVNNFISGLILLFERPIQVGDTIEIEALIGRVQGIGIRSSTVRTFDGAEVIVPNGDLIAGRVVNWTLSDRQRRVEIPIGVAYGSDPRQVIELLTAVAARHPEALNHPPPETHFVAFGDSSLNFAVRVWTKNFDSWWQLRTDVFAAAYEALAEAGIEIPFPQRDLHLRSVDREVSDVLGLAARKDPPAS